MQTKVPQTIASGSLSRARFILGVFATVLFAVLACTASEKEWSEVRSQHFRVITDGGERDARRVVREFEQIRFAMNMLYPALRLDSGAPLLVLCPRDESSMRALAPQFWKSKGFKPAGLFRHGWDKEYAVVRLDEVRPESYEVVYHEYVHSLMHLNIRWLPLWLDEGLADLHANTRFEKTRIYVGAPSWRLSVLRSRPPVPLSTILDVTPGSPYYRDEDKASIFYAQSWMLTHYLFFGPGMESGKKLLRFIALLENTEEKKAFLEVFGDPKEVEKGLETYGRTFSLPGGYLNTPASTDDKAFTSRKMSVAQTEAELGSYHLWTHDLEMARPLIEQALKDDPKLGLAHEDMAFLDFAEGKDEDAVREFTAAVSLDPKLYLSLFSLTMMSSATRSNAPDGLATVEISLLKVVDQNPQFAPALVQLARLYARRGNLEQAFQVSRRAEQLEPARAGYHLLSGQLLQRMGRGAEAASFARYVASRWQGPDHDEAVELWNSVPAGQRPADEALSASAVAGTQVLEGRVKSVTCGRHIPENEAQKFTVVLEKEGSQFRFQAKGGFGMGFSDTLWWGRDHFSSCQHIEGLRAVVHYKPSSGPNDTGELARLDLRDDLGQVPAQTKPGESGSPETKSEKQQ